MKPERTCGGTEPSSCGGSPRRAHPELLSSVSEVRALSSGPFVPCTTWMPSSPLLFWVCLDGCLAVDKARDPRAASLGEAGAPFGRGGGPGRLQGPLYALSPCDCHVVAKLGTFKPPDRSRAVMGTLFLSLKVEVRPGGAPQNLSHVWAPGSVSPSCRHVCWPRAPVTPEFWLCLVQEPQ